VLIALTSPAREHPRAPRPGRRARLAGAVITLAAAGLAPQAAEAARSSVAPAQSPSVTLPDMKLLVPESQISIGTNAKTGVRQLQFTHVTWDAGTGPFEIDPDYDSATGQASFTQAIYNSPSPGVWQFDHSVPLAVTGTFDPPFDYRFPLSSFTLNQVNADGSVGSVVVSSPKTDFCITGDTYVGGVPNTPAQTFIPQGNCKTPTKPLGWSVGWGDEYDQTDNGQPISLAGVPDGTYILQGIADPDHVLTESDPDNNVVDTKLTISGNSVTVLSQTSPVVSPPTVALTSPASGSNVSGPVTLQATAAATAPARVASVQYLLDGQPLGAPVTVAPYSFSWAVGSTPLGTHQLSARVTDTDGSIGTAPVESVTVVSPTGPAQPAVDQSVTRTGVGAVTSPAFSTASAGETLVAFAGSDGPAGAGKQALTVSGAGLTWKLVQRANGRSGDAEIWTATAPGQLTGATVTATPSVGGYDEQLTVLTFTGAGGVGASAAASAASGAPSAGLTTTAAGSLSYAVGNDYDNAVGRTVDTGQQLIGQWIDTATGDTYWVQGTSAGATAAGQHLTLGDTAPTGDQWNLAAAEVTPAAGPDKTPPTVSITNPAGGQVVSGKVPVAADASDNVGVASVQFYLDGTPLGDPVTKPPYAITWDTTLAAAGAHVLTAQATDTSGNVGKSAAVDVTVQNPAPPMTCFVMQAQESVHGHGTVTTPAFHTAAAGETLLAFAGSDGPDAAGAQHVTVSGAGLTWTLVRRANGQAGDAEIWQATAPAVLTSATVTATPAVPGYDMDLTVIAMEGTDGVGASAAASGPSGAPSVSLTTTDTNSLVFAVGDDWDTATARTMPPGWVPLDQWLDTRTGDTYWSQYTNVPVPAAGTLVQASDTAPTTDRWNMAAVELTSDGD
jgi:Bacterial Ig domain/Lysyl oxidase